MTEYAAMLYALSALCVILGMIYFIPVARARGARALAAQGPAIVLSVWLTVCGNLLMLFPEQADSRLKILLVSQALLCPAWLLFSLSYARQLKWAMLDTLNRLLVAFSFLPLAFVLFLPVSSFFFVTDFAVERLIFLESNAFFFFLQVVILLLLSVGNLESTLRDSRHSERWRIKLALLGAGVIVASFTLFYSQGLLVRMLNMNYLPLRGLGVLCGLALLNFSEWRRQAGTVRLPRRVAFRSIAAVVAGLYLLGLGVAREGARIFGAGFERDLLIALLSLVGLAGLLILLSDRVRRRVIIRVQRALYNEKYDYRGQWIQFSERLSAAADKDSLIRAVLLGFCETFGFGGAVFVPKGGEGPGAPIYYEIDPPDRAGTSNSAGSGAMVTSDCAPLLSWPGGPTRLNDARAQLPENTEDCLRAMAASLFFSVPAAEGPEGVVILCRPIDRKEEYDAEDFELMEAMRRQFGLCVRSFRLGDELSTAREMEAFGRIGAFVLHDLKNQVYTLSLLAENARTFIANPDFQRDMLESLGGSVANLKRLVTQLTDLPRGSTLRVEPVDLREVARRAAAQVPGANIRISGGPLIVQADADQICKVLINLFLNAVEAGGDKPIQLETVGGEAPLLRVRDECGGIAEDIIQRGLFKPFNSGKQRGMGIGLYHSQKIMEAHGGKILVENRPGEGSTFTVRFGPAAGEAA